MVTPMNADETLEILKNGMKLESPQA